MAEPALAYSQPQQEPDPREGERLKETLKAIVGRLEREADDRVSKRQTVEKRWLEDLRQFSGEYEQKIFKDLDNAKKSTLFINQTRPKTNAAEARLSDMLFPTDDKNWGISPTPVPALTEQAKAATAQAKQMVGQANEATQGGDPAQGMAIAGQAQQVANVAQQAKATMDEAKKRAEAMAAEIDDQLVECGYNIQARDGIKDACRIGTGVMKGPVGSTDRARRAWSKAQQPDGATVYQLDTVADARPAYYRVDPWSFFPEPDAKTIEESESFFERHMMTKKDLRRLAKQPGFDKDAIRRVLKEEPSKTLPTYLTELRAIIGENNAPQDGRYTGWEYRGTLTAEDMRDICACMGKQNMAQEYAPEEVDPLDEINVVLWFCQGEILKFGVHHLDSGEAIYSVYNLEKDDSSIWGFGIPTIMRNSQKAMNGAWRMMMDNAGLSSGPQIEIDRNVVEPSDGEWTLTARKLWLRKAGAPSGKPGIITYDIPSHQPELAAIIELSKMFIDDETAISVLAQGEQGAHTTKTSSGMALLMNAVNVVFRRMVKNFDDDMTVPNIRRLYDWNMQFSPKEQIKGDFDVDARGTSVLLVREIQSQNLMVLAQFTAHPVLGMLLKAAPLLRKTVQSMMITADDVVKTDDEIAQEAEAMKNQPPEQDPRIQAQLQIAHDNNQTTLQVEQLRRDTQMLIYAEKKNMSLDEVRAKLHAVQMQVDSKERILAAEVAVESRNPSNKGSGGYISGDGENVRPN